MSSSSTTLPASQAGLIGSIVDRLHLLPNEVGQLLNAQLTPGNVDDRRPIPDLLQGLFGKFCADRGYVSQKLAINYSKILGFNFLLNPDAI